MIGTHILSHIIIEAFDIDDDVLRQLVCAVGSIVNLQKTINRKKPIPQNSFYVSRTTMWKIYNVLEVFEDMKTSNERSLIDLTDDLSSANSTSNIISALSAIEDAVKALPDKLFELNKRGLIK